jgi:type I restriction enzyme S subunit
MQGKLVPQDPSDQSARELLKEIEAEKSRLVKDGKIKASKPLPEIKPDEVPYDLPKAWEWVRLGDIIFDAKTGIDKGKEFQSESNDYPYFKMNNISNFGYCDFSNVNRINYEGDDYKKYVLRDGDFLFNTRNSKELVGKTCIFQSPNNELWFFNNNILRIEFSYSIEKYFANFWFLSRLGKIELEKLKSATTNVAAIYQGRLVLFPIPIPPLAEQRRIVAKIDELMARCDELEKLRQVHAQKQITVHNAALNQLLTAKDHNDFKTSWHFITQHFGELYSVKANVAELRKAILQLAVMGKLVPQDPNDQPASVLVNTIKAKKILAREKTKNNSTGQSFKNFENIPFKIPSSWTWQKVVDLYDVSGGIQKTPQRTPLLNFSPYLRVANVQRGRLNLEKIEYFELLDGELDKWRLQSGDLLVVEGNGSDKEIGRCAIWNGEIENCVHQNHIIRMRPINHDGQLFTLIFLNSPSGMAEMRSLAITTSGLYSLSVGKIREILIPFPPLAEQHRIVAKIDQLMTLCDELEKQIDIADHKKTNLLNSVMTKV